MIICQLQIHEGLVQVIVTFLLYLFGPTYESPIDFWLKFLLKKDLMKFYISGDSMITDFHSLPIIVRLRIRRFNRRCFFLLNHVCLTWQVLVSCKNRSNLLVRILNQSHFVTLRFVKLLSRDKSTLNPTLLNLFSPRPRNAGDP